jgi:hypothetical protein
VRLRVTVGACNGVADRHSAPPDDRAGGERAAIVEGEAEVIAPTALNLLVRVVES